MPPKRDEALNPENTVDETVDIEALLGQIVRPLIDQLSYSLHSELKTIRTELAAKTAAPEQVTRQNEETPGLESGESAVVKALQAKVAQLEKDAADREAARQQEALQSALKDAVASGNPEDYTLAMAGLTQFAGKLTQVDGKYISDYGKDLSVLAADFYASPSGKRCLPSTIKPGTNQPPSNVITSNTGSNVTLEDQLLRDIDRL